MVLCPSTIRHGLVHLSHPEVRDGRRQHPPRDSQRRQCQPFARSLVHQPSWLQSEAASALSSDGPWRTPFRFSIDPGALAALVATGWRLHSAFRELPCIRCIGSLPIRLRRVSAQIAVATCHVVGILSFGTLLRNAPKARWSCPARCSCACTRFCWRPWQALQRPHFLHRHGQQVQVFGGEHPHPSDPPPNHTRRRAHPPGNGTGKGLVLCGLATATVARASRTSSFRPYVAARSCASSPLRPARRAWPGTRGRFAWSAPHAAPPLATRKACNARGHFTRGQAR
mmetsp:Transcript_17088/g.64702  ORF Transcript_17088/g.64702 Transcript_17088/m.64702 type:complete len:284 (-) Transcript_17088:158-1009(-)